MYSNPLILGDGRPSSTRIAGTRQLDADACRRTEELAHRIDALKAVLDASANQLTMGSARRGVRGTLCNHAMITLSHARSRDRGEDGASMDLSMWRQAGSRWASHASCWGSRARPSDPGCDACVPLRRRAQHRCAAAEHGFPRQSGAKRRRGSAHCNRSSNTWSSCSTRPQRQLTKQACAPVRIKQRALTSPPLPRMHCVISHHAGRAARDAQRRASAGGEAADGAGGAVDAQVPAAGSSATV